MLIDGVALRPEERAAVAGLWRYREQVEREAAALFAALGADLAAAGLPALAARATAAADDERRHAIRCRAIIDGVAATPLAPIAPRPLSVTPPGPRDPDPSRRALYASVAIGCVTESLSCALLLAMREPATFPPTCSAIDEIIKDEIEHSRIGWAHLATAAGTGDVSWLAPHIAAMRTAALTHDVADLPTAPDLSAFGILPRARVAEVVDAAWRDVVAPGLARYGIA
jgi:hypothetical protein